MGTFRRCISGGRGGRWRRVGRLFARRCGPTRQIHSAPQAFRDAAVRIITAFAQKVATTGRLLDTCSKESFSRWETLAKQENALDTKDEAHLNILRFALLDFIADFANWDNSTVPEYLETARALTQTAHEALGGEPDTRPLVVDPFAGGGSIPLEALRVGADAFASDLNPVAVLLNKVVLEYIPKYGQRLADEVRKWGQWIKEQAEKELAEFYPKDPDGATPIAYLWARTIKCEGPGCGAEVPLLRSLWLAKRNKNSMALRLVPRPRAKRVDFEIIESAKAKDVPEGTVRRGSATCPVCGFTTPVASVRRQLKERRGGAADARLFCVVTTRPDQQGRFYRLSSERDRLSVEHAAQELKRRRKGHKGPLSLIPEEALPVMSGVFNAPIYGTDTWGTLFSSRQLLALTAIAKLIRKINGTLNLPGLAQAVQVCLALGLGRLADRCSSLCTWDPSPAASGILHTFGRQALPFVFDFAEGMPLEQKSGGWLPTLEWIPLVIERETRTYEALSGQATVTSASAIRHPLPDDSANALVTDPPYYNAVPYADLSDFFYVWLRRSFGQTVPELFVEGLSPKQDELCEMAGWDPVRYGHKTASWFEAGMRAAMAEARRVVEASGIGVIVFAHKSTVGWESQLQAMIEAGWIVTGSWPIDTEMGNRLRAMKSAALASSVHLVCRPRDHVDDSSWSDAIGDWRDVLAKLPTRIHEWMPRLASEGIVGADAIFACLGPALEIFSRYSRVEKADGTPIPLKDYLEHVWAAVAKEALSMIFTGADATGFEPDARLTAMWLWTLSTGANGNGAGDDTKEETDEDEELSGKGSIKGGFVLEYDAARKIAQGLGAHLEQMPNIVEVKGDKARLLAVSERARHLFGKDEGKAPAKRSRKPKQKTFFEEAGGDGEEGGWGEMKAPQIGNTALDRIHQSMILFAAGRSEALKRFLVEEGAGRDPRFWRLAQALSALYPAGTEEKRWVDGVLARKKGLGF